MDINQLDWGLVDLGFFEMYKLYCTNLTISIYRKISGWRSASWCNNVMCQDIVTSIFI